jgi:hypothetical protein
MVPRSLLAAMSVRIGSCAKAVPGGTSWQQTRMIKSDASLIVASF